MTRTLLSLLVAATLAGCAVTQPVTPKLDLPAGSATAAQNELLTHWWTAFNDPVLDALVEEAFANNLDIRSALARVDAARSQVTLAQSYLMPSVDLGVNAGRSRISANTTPALPAGTPQAAISTRCSCRRPTRSTSGASTAAASWPRPTISWRRSTTASRCASP